MLVRLTGLFAFLLLQVPMASAQLYKWVDSQGKVHYSDQQPPLTTKPKELAVEPSPKTAIPPGSQPSASGSVDWKRQDSELRRRMEARSRRDAPTNEEMMESSGRRQCEMAQKSLKQAEDSPAYRNADGTNNFAERTAGINRARSSMEAACSK